VRDQILLVVLAGGEFVNVEGTVESRAQLVRVNQRPDFSGFAGNSLAMRRAARRAIADVSDPVGEDLAVERRDPLGDFGFVGEL
jgi:hypothetical protein